MGTELSSEGERRGHEVRRDKRGSDGKCDRNWKHHAGRWEKSGAGAEGMSASRDRDGGRRVVEVDDALICVGVMRNHQRGPGIVDVVGRVWCCSWPECEAARSGRKHTTSTGLHERCAVRGRQKIPDTDAVEDYVWRQFDGEGGARSQREPGVELKNQSTRGRGPFNCNQTHVFGSHV